MRIALIGCGVLGVGIAQRLLERGVSSREELFVLQRGEERVETLSALLHCVVSMHPRAEISQADAVILAVRPQDFSGAAEAIRRWINPQQLILSVMAGITNARISQELNGALEIVRCMSNLPCQIGLGLSHYFPAPSASEYSIRRAEQILGALGEVLPVSEESRIDAATAVSGSGPGYVFCFIDALLSSAQKIGFTEAEAHYMVYSTLNGALQLWNSSNRPARSLLESMRLKGGTTETAYRIFEQRGFKNIIDEAMEAAFARVKAISK